MEEKERKEAPKVRRVTQSLPPPKEVGGRGTTHSYRKPTQIPPNFPAHFPGELEARTTMILAEAVRKFPEQTEALELCKYVISEMTPLFRDLVRAGRLRASAVLSEGGGGMADLLHSLLVYNCDHDGERGRLGQEARKSDEWLKLAKEVAEVQDRRDYSEWLTRWRSDTEWVLHFDETGPRMKEFAAIVKRMRTESSKELDDRLSDLLANPEIAEAARKLGLPRVKATSSHLQTANPDIGKRRLIVLQNPRATAKTLCGLFGDERISLPPGWERDLTKPTWTEAYKNKKLRARIQRIISTDRKAQ